MSERTKSEIARMTPPQIVGFLRAVAEYERSNRAITFDHGTDIINVIAIHGDQIADALEKQP